MAARQESTVDSSPLLVGVFFPVRVKRMEFLPYGEKCQEFQAGNFSPAAAGLVADDDEEISFGGLRPCLHESDNMKQKVFITVHANHLF
ncbi:MAG: hypothetical protein WC382_07515 [Methanoregulaceae archaeon]|jgi:hypothetical protein